MTLRPSANDMVAYASFEAAASGAALVCGVDLAALRAAPSCPSAPARARAIATYLAVTTYNVPRRHLAAARGLNRRTLRRCLAAIEDRRDDPAFDALVARAEQLLEAAS